jgi:hypothetical protein
MKALMRKMDKLTNEMISKHDFLVIRERRLKDLLVKHFFLQIKI